MKIFVGVELRSTPILGENRYTPLRGDFALYYLRINSFLFLLMATLKRQNDP